jgi:dTMP kinase
VFITFEGPEGSGKTTQVTRLAARLRSSGRGVTVTREPGGTAAGERIRAVLLDPAVDSLQPETEALLFCAARMELVHRVVRPSLAAGHVVLCDRFADATLAYQGFGRGAPLEWLQALNETVTASVQPDLTLLFDLPVERGLDRRRSEGDWNRMDNASIEFHRRVRDGYLTLAKLQPERWAVIDALADVESVATAVEATLRQRLGLTLGNDISRSTEPAATTPGPQ